MNKHSIVFAMIEAGGGHKSPANAVSKVLSSKVNDSAAIQVMDFCKEIGALRDDSRHKRGWDRALSTPRLTRIAYYIVDFLGPLTRLYIRISFRETRRKAALWFEENRPRVFFATHFINAAAAVDAKKRIKDFQSKIILFASDPHDISALWIWKDVDFLIVCSEEAKEKALKRGFCEDKIRIFPYPVDPSFLRVDGSVRENLLGEKSERLTILFSAGGQGISRIGESVKRLIKDDLPINILAVCGRNEKLYKELSSLKIRPGSQTSLIPYGFVKNMNELIQASDLVVIKAGAASTYEALYLKKPIIFMDYVAYNEKANIEYVLDKGLGWWVKNDRELEAILLEITREDYILEQKNKELQKLSLSNGADSINEFIINYI